MSITLDQILKNDSIPLKHDKLEFQLVPFNSRDASAWNETQFRQPGHDDDPLEFANKVFRDQLELIRSHLLRCRVKGDEKRVTVEWLETEFPRTVITDLSVFFVEGSRPDWAPARLGKTPARPSR